MAIGYEEIYDDFNIVNPLELLEEVPSAAVLKFIAEKYASVFYAQSDAAGQRQHIRDFCPHLPEKIRRKVWNFINRTEKNGNCKLIQLHEFDNLSKEEVEKYNARHISRFLKGSMVIFHKNSLYNLLISNYKGEHDIVGAEQFRGLITDYCLKLKGKTIADFSKQKAVETATE